jgi:short-subunit dehydrogenase
MPQALHQKLAVITGASSGIGYQLALLCAADGCDLVVAADEPEIEQAAESFRSKGVTVAAVMANLATTEGCDQLYEAIGGRAVDLLLANAGTGLGGGFLDQEWDRVRHIVDTNITGTIYLVQKIARDMRERNEGRILITGSIAGFIPGAYHAVYNASKAFLDSFSFALRAELDGTAITVTCLMPGATETEFFERAGLLDTELATAKKDDPADVARTGYDAMMAGEGDVVSGWTNKLRSAIANITPAAILAEQHRKMAAPGSARR